MTGVDSGPSSGQDRQAGRKWRDSRIATLPVSIENGDFGQGLKGWRVVSGMAFAKQPVKGATIGSEDVEIDGKQLVPLGGGFWHTPYPIGQHGNRLIRALTKAAGILDSNPFTVSARYLLFRLGGNAGGSVVLELRVPAVTASAAKLKPFDKPDADGFVAVRIAEPSGSDVLREVSLDFVGKQPAKSLLGAPAKVRLRMSGARTRQRLLVDHIRTRNTRPRPFIRRCGDGPTSTATRRPRLASATSSLGTCTARSRTWARAFSSMATTTTTHSDR